MPRCLLDFFLSSYCSCWVCVMLLIFLCCCWLISSLIQASISTLFFCASFFLFLLLKNALKSFHTFVFFKRWKICTHFRFSFSKIHLFFSYCLSLTLFLNDYTWLPRDEHDNCFLHKGLNWLYSRHTAICLGFFV